MSSGNTYPDRVQGPADLQAALRRMVAVDMNRGEQLWRVPLGGPPTGNAQQSSVKGLKLDLTTWASSISGRARWSPRSLLSSATPATIRAAPARRASRLRQEDRQDGLEDGMPTLSTGAPMTYMHKGRQ